MSKKQICKNKLMLAQYYKKIGGFTFIELVIVLTVLGILSVVAMPKMIGIPSMRLNMAARKVQADIRYAQSLAVSTQKWTGVFFSSGDDNYSVYIDTNGASPASWSIVTNPFTRQNFTVQLNSEEFTGIDITLVQFNQQDRALAFDKRGNPYDYDNGSGIVTALGSSSRIRLSASSGTTDVRVERGTGRVYTE